MSDEGSDYYEHEHEGESPSNYDDDDYSRDGSRPRDDSSSFGYRTDGVAPQQSQTEAESDDVDASRSLKKFHATSRIFDFRLGKLPQGVRLMKVLDQQEMLEKKEKKEAEKAASQGQPGASSGAKEPEDEFKASDAPVEVMDEVEVERVIGGGNDEVPSSARCLSLGERTFLHVDLAKAGGQDEPGQEKYSNGLLNDYTIIMDVNVEKLAPNGLSLFALNLLPKPQCQQKQTEGEAFVSRQGGVGTFDEYGKGENWLKENKWARVTVTFGGQRGRRCMTTYVNGKKVASVVRGVFEKRNDRFALDPHNFAVFFSKSLRLMPGVKIKTLEVVPYQLTDDEVLSQAAMNKIFGYWKEEQARLAQRQASLLSLHEVYKRPPLAWNDATIMGLFMEKFISPGAGTYIHIILTLFIYMHAIYIYIDIYCMSIMMLTHSFLPSLLCPLE